MGILQLPKLVELLNAGDLKRCGCAQVDLQQFFKDPSVMTRALQAAPVPPFRPEALDTSSEDEEDIPFFSLANAEADDQSDCSTASPQLDSKLWLGPEEPQAKAGHGFEQVFHTDLLDSLSDIESAQPISWQLPPLTVPALPPSNLGTSLWSARQSSAHFTAPVAVTSSVPFSALLRKSLDTVAWEAGWKHGASASESCASLGYKRHSFEGASNRKLSAAELWLGPGPAGD